MNRCLLLAVSILLSDSSHAEVQRRTEYCRGFEEGWKPLSGGITPICPIEPITPIGSTPFREGVKDGMQAAKRQGGATQPMSSRRENAGTFCEGFAEGYKAVKGNLVIVPICPIPPITPIGSTEYREGLKAGIKKARDG